MDPSGTGAPERELRRRKGSRTLESHLPGERSNEPEESPDAEKSVAVSRSTEKPIKNPTDHLNYGHSHQKLRRLGGGWAPNPRLQRRVPGLGGGAERKLLGRSRNQLTGQRLPGRLENKAVTEEGSNTPGVGKGKATSEGTWEKSLVCARAGEGREEGVGPHRIPPTPQQAYRPTS